MIETQTTCFVSFSHLFFPTYCKPFDLSSSRVSLRIVALRGLRNQHKSTTATTVMEMFIRQSPFPPPAASSQKSDPTEVTS